MVIYRCGVESRVDSAEKDLETSSDYITDRFISGFKQLLSGRSGFHDEFSFKGALFPVVYLLQYKRRRGFYYGRQL